MDRSIRQESVDSSRDLFVGLGLDQTGDPAAVLPLTTLGQQRDAFEALENVAAFFT